MREEKDKQDSAPEVESADERLFTFRDLIDGRILTRKAVARQLSFILFISVLALMLIANRYRAENLYRKLSAVKTEVENLKAEQVTVTARLMNMSRPSTVARMADEKGLGLKELTAPPIILKHK